MMKLAHNFSYEALGTLFSLKHADKDAICYVYRQLLWTYMHKINIPQIIRQDGSVNNSELDKLYNIVYNNTEEFYKTFQFQDPKGLNRKSVFINIDATYLFTENSSDIEFQKSFFYLPKATHVVKWLTLTDLSGKIVGLCPSATSQTPASGDAHILSRYISLEDSSETGHYLRTFLSGNHLYFVVLIVDAGFVAVVPNAPVEVRNLPTLVDVCESEEVGAVLLHTSNKHFVYHLELNNGKLRKIDRDEDEPRPTLDEATIKFSRLLRKPQEQSFGCLKRMFKFLGTNRIPNSLVKPLSKTQLKALKIPEEYKKVPKITFFAVCICSIYNDIHAGFKLLFFNTPEQQRAAALNIIARLKPENPLLHDIFNHIQFTRRVRGPWTDLTFGDFTGDQNPINFPRLRPEEVNPVFVQLASGPHAIQRGISVLTYISQLHVKKNNIQGLERKNILESFPTFHKVQYLRVETQPVNWDETLFGPWQPMTFVRCLMPPSNRTATDPKNFHMVVVAVGDVGSDRLGLVAPFDRILFWYCYDCPSLNALVSMDRHLAALIIGLSCQEIFKSTVKDVNLNVLNPVADRSQQCLVSLSRLGHSTDIREQHGRKTRDRRNAASNPLYACGQTISAPSSPSRAAQSSTIRRSSTESSARSSGMSRSGSRARGGLTRGQRSSTGSSDRSRGSRGGAADRSNIVTGLTGSNRTRPNRTQSPPSATVAGLIRIISLI